jgi:hypothetical protein
VTALTKNEYLATFVEPMRSLGLEESYKPVRMEEYVADCIREFSPSLTSNQLQIQHIYLNGDKSFYHVLINYGQQNRLLVVVVDCNREAVHGHYWLDLNSEYGLDENS